MSGQARRWLLILGIILILVSVALIFSLLTPGETGQAQATLQPTLFLPPGGAP